MSQLGDAIKDVTGTATRQEQLQVALRQAAAMQALAGNLVQMLIDLGAKVESRPDPETSDGCKHADAFETTTFATKGHSFACPDCGAEWTAA